MRVERRAQVGDRRRRRDGPAAWWARRRSARISSWSRARRRVVVGDRPLDAPDGEPGRAQPRGRERRVGREQVVRERLVQRRAAARPRRCRCTGAAPPSPAARPRSPAPNARCRSNVELHAGSAAPRSGATARSVIPCAPARAIRKCSRSRKNHGHGAVANAGSASGHVELGARSSSSVGHQRQADAAGGRARGRHGGRPRRSAASRRAAAGAATSTRSPTAGGAARGSSSASPRPSDVMSTASASQPHVPPQASSNREAFAEIDAAPLQRTEIVGIGHTAQEGGRTRRVIRRPGILPGMSAGAVPGPTLGGDRGDVVRARRHRGRTAGPRHPRVQDRDAARAGARSSTPPTRSHLFYALLLKDAGCSANSARMAALFGADDHVAKRTSKRVDWSGKLPAFVWSLRTVAPGGTRPRAARPAARDQGRGRGHARADAGPLRPRRRDRPHARPRDRDGRGDPRARRALGRRRRSRAGCAARRSRCSARILCLAQTVEIFHAAGGVGAAWRVARRRRGGWFDPALVDALGTLLARRGLLGLAAPTVTSARGSREDRLLIADDDAAGPDRRARSRASSTRSRPGPTGTPTASA